VTIERSRGSRKGGFACSKGTGRENISRLQRGVDSTLTTWEGKRPRVSKGSVSQINAGAHLGKGDRESLLRGRSNFEKHGRALKVSGKA